VLSSFVPRAACSPAEGTVTVPPAEGSELAPTALPGNPVAPRGAVTPSCMPPSGAVTPPGKEFELKGRGPLTSRLQPHECNLLATARSEKIGFPRRVKSKAESAPRDEKLRAPGGFQPPA